MSACMILLKPKYDKLFDSLDDLFNWVKEDFDNNSYIIKSDQLLAFKGYKSYRRYKRLLDKLDWNILYDDEFGKESAFIFDANEGIDDLEDDYYNKYKFFVAGYGIYLDNDLNVEYGYVTNDITGNIINTVPVDNTYHDFNDARDGDRIKEHICSLINSADIWKTDDAPIVMKTDDVAIMGGLDQEAVLKYLWY